MVGVEGHLPVVTMSHHADGDTLLSLMHGWYVIAYDEAGTVLGEGRVQWTGSNNEGQLTLLDEDNEAEGHVIPLHTIGRVEVQ